MGCPSHLMSSEVMNYNTERLNYCYVNMRPLTWPCLSINIFRNINSIESALPAPEPSDSEGQYSELDLDISAASEVKIDIKQ